MEFLPFIFVIAQLILLSFVPRKVEYTVYRIEALLAFPAGLILVIISKCGTGDFIGAWFILLAFINMLSIYACACDDKIREDKYASNEN
jgi:hypothetical protein